MEELLDIYDNNKQKTGKMILRSKEMQLLEGEHILITALLVQNDEGKIMMQLTSKEKGRLLALPGGHVTHGENSKDAITRELFEEQGIVINKEKINLVEERLGAGIAFFDMYYLKENFDKSKMTLQKEEVEDIIWMTPEKIFSAYEEGKVRKSSMESIKNFLSKN